MNLLRLADFRRFWAGQTVSLFGDQISLLALPLVAVLVLDAGAADMGYLGAAALAPHLLFSLLAGVWLDRVARRRRIMIAADLLRTALVASIPLAYALDALTFAQLYAVAFLTGSLAVAFDISYSTIFVSVVARSDYVEANALLNGSRSLSFVGGPSLAGILVQLVGAPATLVGDAISYLASALFLGRVQAAEPPLEPGHDGSVRTRVAEGMRFIANHPIFRPSLLAVATINLFNFMFFALGCVLFPAPLVLVPLAEGPEWLVLGMLFAAEFLSGLGVMILDISAGAIIPALTPHRLRSRATGAFRFVNYGVRPVGALIGGALGSAIGLRPTLWIATVGAIAGALWLLPSPVPGLRELPEEAS